jgi:hypothetical protein
LGNRILYFFLKLEIVPRLDQAQTVWVSQGMARWSPSRKYSRILTSTKKCINTFFPTLLGNRSSSAMAHYGMEIYNNNAIMPSFYTNPEVRYTNYLSTPQAYNTNVVNRSHVAIPVSSSHANTHNSYSSTDMYRWSNHNAYVFEHASNMHNRFVPPYSSTEPTSHYTPQIHMSMSNYYS